MKKKIIFIVLLVTILGMVFILVGGSEEQQNRQIEQTAAREENETYQNNGEQQAEQNTEQNTEEQLTEQEVTTRTADNTIEVFGTVRAREERNLMLNFPVIIEEIYVREGQKVTADQELIALDIREGIIDLQQKQRELALLQEKIDTFEERQQRSIRRLENELESKRINRELEQARLQRFKDELESEDSPVFRQYKQKISAAEEDLKRQQQKLESRKSLLERGAITPEEFEEYEERVRQSENRLEELRLSLAELRYNREREVEKLEGSLSSAKQVINNLRLQTTEEEYTGRQDLMSLENEAAQLTARIKQLEQQFARDYISDSSLVSMFAEGVVYNIDHRPGDYVRENTTLMNILDRKSLYVEAEVSEDFAGNIREGMAVTITPLANITRDNSAAGNDYQGIITSVAAKAVEKRVETVVPVEISIDDPDEYLLPEYNVDVEIELE